MKVVLHQIKKTSIDGLTQPRVLRSFEMFRVCPLLRGGVNLDKKSN